MKQAKVIVLMVLILSMVLTACGGGDETAGEGGDEANTDTSTSENEENEETAETTVALADEMRADEGGYAFQPPVGYDVEVDYIFAEMSLPGDEDTTINIIGTPFADGMGIDDMYDGFASEFGSDEDVTLGERQPLSINGIEGFSATLEGDDDGTAVKGKLIALGNETQGVFIFGGSEAEKWDAEISEQFDAVVNSISLFAPIEAAIEESSSETDTAAVAVEATEEPVAEPTVAPVAEATEEPAAETDSSVKEPAPVSTGSTDAGFACFGSMGDGVTCLTADGQWQQYTRDNSGLGGNFVSDMTVCPDETMLIAHSDGVSAFDGEDFREYESGWGYGSPEGVACAASGDIWVAYFGGAAHYDGSAWTMYESAEHLATGEQASDLVNDVIVDNSGNVWVVTSNAIAMFDGANWTRYQMGEGLNDKYFFDQLVLDANGSPWALHSGGLLEFDGEAWINHENNDFFSSEAVAIAPDGTYWLTTYRNGLYSFDESG